MRIVTLLLALLAQVTIVAASKIQFQHWYPTFRTAFVNIVQNNCSQQYQDYLAGNASLVSQTGYRPESTTTQMVTCIMNNADDSMKANMQSSIIVLGLTPTYPVDPRREHP